MKYLFILASALVLLFSSCDKDDNPSQPYDSGVFIIQEGAFSGGSGSVSHYNRSKGGNTNDIFGLQNNGATIGNILQSMAVTHEKAYLMVNNANKIVIADAGTFKYSDSLMDVIYPRYMLETDHHVAYISQWGLDGLDGAIRVLNTSTNTFTKTIPTGKGADRMLLVGNSVWVVNNGGFGQDSTVAIININTETVTTKLNVGVAPNSLVLDANGDVWVLCGGDWGAPNGTLLQIKNNAVSATFNVPQGSSSLVTNNAKNTLYFLGSNAIYQKDLTTSAPAIWVDKPTTSSTFGNLYGLGFDPKSSNLYLADAKDFSSAGTVYVFNGSKVLQDSMTTGVAPSNFWFQ